MAREGQTKAERKRARARGPTKAKRKETRAAGQTKAERRVVRAGRTGRPDPSLSALESDSKNGAKQTIGESEPASAAPQDVFLDRRMLRGLERALRPRLENVVPVREPLALISQAQRSGGTLLARLFDGHPQCHAHPHELHIGHPRPHVWPKLGLDEQPEAWFAKLKEEKLTTLFTRGWRRVPLKAQKATTEEIFYPFILPPSFQRLLFLEEVARLSPITSEREILDCYMTSLFNAWLDNQNLRGPDKRWVVAFSPRRAWGEGLEKFFELYPDGRLISILRDPLSWYTSAQGRSPAADFDELLEVWKRSAREMLEADRRYSERVRIVRFDELLLDTPGAMRRLADYLGIEFDPQLTIPSFNGYPVGPNSSYEASDTGIMTEPAERYREILSDERQELIRAECEDLFREALELAEGQAALAGEDRPRSAETKVERTEKEAPLD